MRLIQKFFTKTYATWFSEQNNWFSFKNGQGGEIAVEYVWNEIIV